MFPIVDDPPVTYSRPETGKQQVDAMQGTGAGEQDIRDFERDGAVCLRGVLTDWVDVIADGIERNLREPSEFASENVAAGEPGHFFDDYCNWQRIPEFQRVVRESPAAAIAAAMMRSRTAQIFHDHVLVKEAGTAKETPWHQDLPYYFVSGEQTVSFWIPVDPVEEATLRFIAGSHRWDKPVRPVRWADDSAFYQAPEDEFMDVPDPETDPDRWPVLEWMLQPGDAIAFHYRTVHGARGNMTRRRRRVLSLRWLGDDVHYVERPGRTSPPFPGHGMVAGERLREDWFPTVWTSS